MSDEPVRTLVVWCPDWPVAALGVPPDRPAAVVVGNRVLACTPRARARGVRAGQRGREAQGCCPELAVSARDEHREARAFEPVAAAVEAHTPRVELHRPGTCAFATRGPSRYFGGDASLARRVHEAVASVLGDRGGVRVGVADGPFAAARAAHHPQVAAAPLVVPPGGTVRFLAPLPVEALERPALTGVLRRLGLGTLGAFAALPAADVAGRFGAEGIAAHRLARGLDPVPLDARPPPPDLAVSLELEPAAERVDQVAFAGKVLADELSERLGRLGLACTRVAVEAETEHAEVLSRLWRHEGILDAGALADRVRWQLEGWIGGTLSGADGRSPSAGVVRLALVPDQVVPATGRQLDFWGGQSEGARRAARALARVEGLLGPEAVGIPEWRGGRSPHERVVLVPAGAVDLGSPRPAASPSWVTDPWPGCLPAPAPSVVHPEPLPAELQDPTGAVLRVDGRGEPSGDPARLSLAGDPWREVLAWGGPWPLDERWWDRRRRRRRARLQVRTAEGAHLLALEQGRWRLEATYD